MDSEAVDLATAARLLGVHYQTAYGWVRSGELPAMLVRGRYQIDVAKVSELAGRRAAPRQPRARRPRGGYDELARTMGDALLDGDERQARRMISGLLDDGVTVTATAQEVLTPALARIGAEWEAGRVSIAVEHRASAIVERILGEHHPTPRGRRRGSVAVAALAGDRHALPTLMAAAALREDRWNVHHLGADVPAGELIDFCLEQEVDLAVVTVTPPEGERAAERARRRLNTLGIPALVGAGAAELSELQRLARDAKRRH